jgi:hypothetical protein
MNKLSKLKLNSYLVSLVYGLIIILFGITNYVSLAIRENTQYVSNVQAYTNSEYDYIFYNPIQDQVDDLEEQSHINTTFGYYQFNANVEFSGNTSQITSIFSRNPEKIGITAFNDNRIFKMQNLNINNYAYIDLTLASRLGLELGSQITLNIRSLSPIELIVERIYYPDSLYTEGILFFNINESIYSNFLTKLEENYFMFGVFVDSNNESQTLDYLKNLKPLGQLQPRKFFGTDFEYQNYVEEFMSRDYSGLIFDKSKIENSLKGIYSNNLVSANNRILYFVLTLSSSYILLLLLIIYSRNTNKILIENFNTRLNISEFKKISLKAGIIHTAAMFIGIALYYMFFIGNQVLTQDFLISSISLTIAGLFGSLIIYIILSFKIVNLTFLKIKKSTTGIEVKKSPSHNYYEIIEQPFKSQIKIRIEEGSFRISIFIPEKVKKVIFKYTIENSNNQESKVETIIEGRDFLGTSFNVNIRDKIKTLFGKDIDAKVNIVGHTLDNQTTNPLLLKYKKYENI